MAVSIREVKRFMVDAMAAVGTVRQHAEQMADVLVAADHRGHYSHGLNRLGEWRSLRAFRGMWVTQPLSLDWHTGDKVSLNKENGNVKR
jgi:hypothetical protein